MDEEKCASPELVNKPGPIQRELTEISAKYDRQGKGYLDSTEIALRRMDSKGKGYLDLDHVYDIVASLQHEQKRSAELIETIKNEQHKSLSLKRALIGMCCFAVLLALANIGTSFAAATLAKDTEVSGGSSDLVTLGGVRVATTNKIVQLTITPIEESQRRSRRHLQEAESLVCGQTLTGEGVQCSLQGEILESDVQNLYGQLCPTHLYHNLCYNGVPELQLTCNGVVSDIRGGMYSKSRV